ncbi:MAG: ATP-dependent 6-phosphofructokinase [Chloroflexota bacterium]|nr:ATP-dependent 6-phosphofructokinase [Chloroflexota bacterium]
MKAIAVLTSGGDAPGMNAAIRAVARVAIDKGVPVYGSKHGYAGLMNDDIIPLGLREVGGVMQHGGTFLGSARAPEFKTVEGRQKALANMAKRDIEGLVVIGGNGSQTGGAALNDMGFPTIGVASTIDNDLIGSDITIGVDTALNIALEAIDRLKVTASSHRRAFLVEVMGRDCGYLALMAAIAGGAEGAVLPEIPTTPEEVVGGLAQSYSRGKSNGIIVVAEGAKHGVEALLAYCGARPDIGFEIRAVTLGHVQRGGTPTAYDRLLATRLGANAAQRLLSGEHGVVVGMIKGTESTTPYADVVGRTKGVDPKLFELAAVLAK